MTDESEDQVQTVPCLLLLLLVIAGLLGWNGRGLVKASENAAIKTVVQTTVSKDGTHELVDKLDEVVKAAFDAGHRQGVRDGVCMTIRMEDEAWHRPLKRPKPCTLAEWNYHLPDEKVTP